METKYKKQELIELILSNEDNFNDMDEEILHAIINERQSRDVHHIHRESLSFGDKMSDKLAEFAGSWKFISIFTGTLLVWIIVNGYFLTKPYDPYPFILLNLILSCIAALQAPIIMMSQNRQEEKDRIRSKNDYKINLKSELIIEDLHKKLDIIIKNQEDFGGRLETLEGNIKNL